MAKIICDDPKLKEVLSKYLAENMKIFKRLSLLTESMWSLNIYDKKPEFNSIVELDLNDQLRINRILNEMITNGDLIINLIGKRKYDDAIEVIWNGKV